MNILFYFILGIFFVDLILPLLESLFGVLCIKLEVLKAKCSVEINKYNLMIEKDTSPSTNPIGFMYNLDTEGEPEEEIIDD